MLTAISRNTWQALFTLTHNDLQGGSIPYFFRQTGAKIEHANGMTYLEHPVVLSNWKPLNLRSRATFLWFDCPTRFLRVVFLPPLGMQSRMRCFLQPVSKLEHDWRIIASSVSCKIMLAISSRNRQPEVLTRKNLWHQGTKVGFLFHFLTAIVEVLDGMWFSRSFDNRSISDFWH